MRQQMYRNSQGCDSETRTFHSPQSFDQLINASVIIPMSIAYPCMGIRSVILLFRIHLTLCSNLALD